MKTTFSFQKIIFAFCAFIVLLLAARAFYSGRLQYVFLLWNIFLAGIPLLITKYLSDNRVTTKWKQFLLLSIWLLFFPNALYIITDLVHLQKTSIVPKWFDAILVFSSAIVGLLMAFASLLKVEQFLNPLFSKKKVAFLINEIKN